MTRLVKRKNAEYTTRELSRRIVDLSLPIDGNMPGVQITTVKLIAKDGWNATTLGLYSHCGTHMDAPRHFVDGSAAIDELPLDVFWGPAKVLDLTPVQPRELISIDHIERWADDIQPGDRLLFRTDWYHRFGTDVYRHELPRLSLELARWLVEKEVALVGVEQPSVADVNDLEEVTSVHQTLFRGDIVIVEGLANLDKLSQLVIEFVAVPLRIRGGDGCPVRALARESNLCD
jgi:kynurenine formamidase